MLNPVAPDGVGVLISGQLDPGTRVAFPDRVNDGIRQRVGDFKGENASDSVNWTGQVLRDYVLPDVKADVLAVWFTEPDGSQHEHGAGSPEGLAELGNSDRDFGLLLDALAKRFPGRRLRNHRPHLRRRRSLVCRRSLTLAPLRPLAARFWRFSPPFPPLLAWPGTGRGWAD